jgi:hypothetical protein
VQDYKDNSSDWGVHFTVQLTEERMREAEAVGLLKKFKLTMTVSTSNMHLFNHKGKITKYDTPEQSEASCPFFLFEQVVAWCNSVRKVVERLDFMREGCCMIRWGVDAD